MPTEKVTFVDEDTVIEAEWANAVEAVVHDVFDDSTTKAEGRTALGVPALAHTHTADDITDIGDFGAKSRGASLREDADTINVDIQGQALESSPSNEEVLVRRPSDGAYRRVPVSTFPTAGGGEANTASNV